MSEEYYASRNELNGLGNRVSVLREDFASCKGDKGARLTAVESWIKDLDAKVDQLKDSQQVLELDMQKVRDEILKKMSLRMTLVVGVATLIMLFAQIAVK